MTVYLVTGPRKYREHPPGEQFIADLDPDVEERAVRIGAIKVVARTSVQLDPERARPPANWEAVA